MLLKFFAYCFAALLTLILIWGLGWLWFAASVAAAAPQDTEISTDAIIVLTGGDRRINAGLDLLAAGKAKQLFISGVNAKVKPKDIVDLWPGDRAKVLCCITLGYTADSTASNARESQEWVRKNDIHSIRLVTANYHIMRSMLMFRSALPGILIYANPVVPADFEPWTRQFWVLTFQEYNKLLATWLRLDLLQSNPALNKERTDTLS